MESKNQILHDFINWYNEHHPENYIPNSRLGNYIHECEGKADSTSEKDLRVCEVIAALPSDVEIFEESQRVAESVKIFLFDQTSFQYGAKWMRSLVDGNAL